MMYFAPQLGQSKAIGSDLLGVLRAGISALIVQAMPRPPASRCRGLLKNSPPPSSSHEKPQLRCDQVKDDSTQDTDHLRTPSSSWR